MADAFIGSGHSNLAGSLRAQIRLSWRWTEGGGTQGDGRQQDALPASPDRTRGTSMQTRFTEGAAALGPSADPALIPHKGARRRPGQAEPRVSPYSPAKPPPAACSVVVGHLAAVHGGALVGLADLAVCHLGVGHPVVGGLHAGHHLGAGWGGWGMGGGGGGINGRSGSLLFLTNLEALSWASAHRRNGLPRVGMAWVPPGQARGQAPSHSTRAARLKA